MGQYYVAVNLDKKQYIHPHRLGDGLKLREFSYSSGGLLTALSFLLAVGNGRGGGDLNSDNPLIGSWAGDRIAIVGDYAVPEDLPIEVDVTEYWRGDEGRDGYTDLSDQMRAIIEEDGLYRFSGSGWMQRTSVYGDSGSIIAVPDMVVTLRR